MNEELNISKYLYAKAGARRIPIGGTFELTPVCNMACKMCYVRMTPEQVVKKGGLMDIEKWLDIARQAKAMGTLYLLITGGEPFTYPNFRELYTELHKMGFVISINTNGTLIDQKVIDWIKDISPARFNITLYGGSAETYKTLCGVGDCYNRTVNAIDLLLNNGMLVRLNASFTKLNICDYDLIHDFARERNIPISAASYMFPPARRDVKEGEEFPRLDPETAGLLAFKRETRAAAHEVILQRSQLIKRTVSAGEKPTEEECEGDGEGMKCRAGRASFWISYDGSMSTCGMMPLPKIDLKQTGFKKGWEYIVEQTDKIKLSPKCEGCSYKKVCSVCAAMCYCETGDFSGKPEYTCVMTKKIADEYLKYADKGSYADKSSEEEL